MVQMMSAGVVALVVLVAAVIALPRQKTDISASSKGGTTAGVEQSPTEDGSTLGSANVPGAGTAGTRTDSGGSASPGGGATTYGSSGSRVRVSSKFVPAKAPGITNTTIYVGVGYSSQSAAGDRAIGAAGAAPSYDGRDVFNAAINYANKHGGFAGRVVKPLYYDFTLTDDFNTQEQAACAYWTQDHKVFAMSGVDEIFRACAKKAGAIAVGVSAATQETFDKYPNLIDPTGTRFDRLGQVTVNGLYKAKYFSGKLGLVTWDDPTYKLALKKGYLASLSKLHIPVAQIAYISIPQEFSALGDMTAQVSSAVAKFKAMGIDHVMIQDGHAGIWAGDGLTFEWMQQSKSQDYHPRYGGNTNNAPGFAANPSDQMDHMLAVDDSDTDKANDVGWKTNQTREKCFKIMADAGYPVSSSNQNDEGIAAQVCDLVFFLQRVINGLPQITWKSFIESAQHLGKSFPSAFVYGTNLFPGRRDGGGMVRTEEYLDSCKCLKYLTPPTYTG